MDTMLRLVFITKTCVLFQRRVNELISKLNCFEYGIVVTYINKNFNF